MDAKSLTLPNGITVGWDGTLASKIQILSLFGITYTPTQTELDEQSRLLNSKVNAKNIPNYATWTPTDWATYYNANISSTQINTIANLTDAKAMLNKMSTVLDGLAKMIMALRDYNFPDLPE